MSKQDNLTDFLTDVADAIREKKGTTEKINPQNFSEEIRSIEGGGGIVPCEFKDVNFYDYEGSILYSYTWDEFVAKNEMPPLPTHHEGLTCQGWNYTLEEVLEQGGRCDVGAIYDTIDNKNHFFVEIPSDNITVIIYYNRSTDTIIDWGDGIIDNIPNTTTASECSHTYTKTGYYDISIQTKGLTLYKNINYPCLQPQNVLKKVYLSNNINTNQGTFCSYSNLNKLMISDKISFCVIHVLTANTGITHINLPRNKSNISYISLRNSCFKTISIPNTSSLEGQCLLEQTKLKYLHIPNNCTVAANFLGQVNSLLDISVGINNENVKKINGFIIKNDILLAGINNGIIPENVIEIQQGAFKGAYCLNKIEIPNSVIKLGRESFSGCINCNHSVYIHPMILNIPSACFYQCNNIPYIDFKDHTQIPTLESTNAIPGNTKIIVPNNLYDEWISATNWSSLASQIVKASEFVEPTN